MIATRHRASDPALAALLALIRDSFAYMDGRIDPPSSMHRLTLEEIEAQCEAGDVWSLGAPPVACMVLTPQPGRLYLGKLAVADAHRRRGLAARLVDIAQDRARALSLPRIVLQSRVELTEVHAAFAQLGFVHTGATAHPGFNRPTSVTMTLDLTPDNTG